MPKLTFIDSCTQVLLHTQASENAPAPARLGKCSLHARRPCGCQTPARLDLDKAEPSEMRMENAAALPYI